MSPRENGVGPRNDVDGGPRYVDMSPREDVGV